MEDEILIESVRDFTCLYDMAHPKYLDMNYKSSLWRMIADRLHQTEENCKKRWANIRDQFKKNLNRRKTKSGQSSKITKKYKYEDALQFLLPYLQNGNMISNIENENEPVNTKREAVKDEDIDGIEELSVSSEPIGHPIEESTELPPSTPTMLSRPPDLPSLSLNSKPIRKRRIPRATQAQKESASSALMKYIIEKNQSQSDIDPIEAFFQGLIPSVKRLSPYNQHIAKWKIFSIIHELEFAEFHSEHDISPAHDSSTSKTNSTNYRSIISEAPSNQTRAAQLTENIKCEY